VNSEGKDDYTFIKSKLKSEDEMEPSVDNLLKNEGTIVIETLDGTENAV
jgi:hypothetical protein